MSGVNFEEYLEEKLHYEIMVSKHLKFHKLKSKLFTTLEFRNPRYIMCIEIGLVQHHCQLKLLYIHVIKFSFII